ncbi:hypothetical protein AOL_s00215g97 [Orbilia oligospora ATCC 24927]|uniref:Uncharacterized protein n=1 Tax=Arthrobotrys oligospora (strain ATCC 24927 / CBS 115.81 / DSM 1491) TaxID=756982 RepID=G1XTG8_ARTOA|nr:hypothetical protein AOL_s00215g97 [Orbilia oligospora ATCC 24927]EGX43361.1 hypothetical protein AOL_s00215g97 [Orbilia oligospora ATCC 24927]
MNSSVKIKRKRPIVIEIESSPEPEPKPKRRRIVTPREEEEDYGDGYFVSPTQRLSALERLRMARGLLKTREPL